MTSETDFSVSIVMPVFNRQALAERALRSVMSEAAHWRDVVIVDDGSSPPFELPSDLKGDPRIRLVRLSVNGGAPRARNAGIDAAEGRWIALLDSDDTWLPGKLAAQLDFAKADQAAQPDLKTFYCTGFRQITTRTGVSVDRYPIEADEPLMFASGCWFSPGSTALFSKAAHQAIGGLDEALPRLEDLDWALKLALAGGRLKVVPILGALVEVGGRPSLQRMEDACRRLEAKWSAEPNAAQTPGLLRRLRAYLDVERAAAARAEGKIGKLALYLARSLVRVPRLRVHLENWWPPLSGA